MNVFFGWAHAKNPEFYRLFDKHMKELGFSNENYMFYGIHDEFVAEHVEKGVAVAAAVKKAVPDLNLACTFMITPPPTGATPEQMDMVADNIKTWIVKGYNMYGHVRAHKMFRPWLKRHPEVKVWIYHCDRGMQGRGLFSYYRMNAWRCYTSGARGLAYWTSKDITGHERKIGNGVVRMVPDGLFDYGDPIAWRMEGMFFSHSRKEIFPTVRFMALVEGLEDYAYMDILGKLINKEEASHRKVGSEIKDLISSSRLEKTIKSATPDLLNKWRHEILKAICSFK